MTNRRSTHHYYAGRQSFEAFACREAVQVRPACGGKFVWHVVSNVSYSVTENDRSSFAMWRIKPKFMTCGLQRDLHLAVRLERRIRQRPITRRDLKTAPRDRQGDETR
jgi:hypothetical protein